MAAEPQESRLRGLSSTSMWSRARRIWVARLAKCFAAVARSGQRGRVAIVIADNLRAHTPAGSLLVRSLLSAFKDHLYLVYTPAYDPDANRIEWLWRVSRRIVTHNH